MSLIRQLSFIFLVFYFVRPSYGIDYIEAPFYIKSRAEVISFFDDIDFKTKEDGVEVIDNEYLAISGHTVLDALTTLNGIQVDNNGENTKILFRGQREENIQLLINGRYVTNLKNGLGFLESFSSFNIKKIEIYKNFSPIGALTSSHGGAINIITKGELLEDSFSASMGEFATSKFSAHLTNHLTKKYFKFNNTFSFNYEKTANNYPFLYNNTPQMTSDDYISDRVNSQRELFNINIDSSYRFNAKSKSNFNFYFSDIKKGIPLPTNRSDLRPSKKNKNFLAHFDLIYNRILPLNGNIEFFFDRSVDESEINSLGVPSILDSNIIKNNLIIDNISTLFSWPRGENFYFLKSVFSKEELRNENLSRGQKTSQSFNLGYQYRKNAVEFESLLNLFAHNQKTLIENSYESSVFSGHLNLTYKLYSFWNIRTSFARHHKFPSLIEVYGDGAFLQENIDLKNEAGETFSFFNNFKFKINSEMLLDFSYEFFFKKVDDLITASYDSFGTSKMFNSASSESLGHDYSIAFSSKVFGLSHTGHIASYKNVSSLGAVNEVPGVPSREWKNSLFLKKYSTTFFIEHLYRSSVFLDELNFLETDESNLVNLNISFETTSFFDFNNTTLFSLRLNDIFDKRPLDLTGVQKRGRYWEVTLNQRF